MITFLCCKRLSCFRLTEEEKKKKGNVVMSGGSKAAELQMQMRQNAEDLHNFMKELDSWEEDMKRKDDELRTGNLADPQVCDFQLTCFLDISAKPQ